MAFMKKTMTYLAALMLVCCIFTSCKKDADDNFIPPVPVDPNEVVETDPAIQKPVVSTHIGSTIHGYYAAVPATYDKTSINYPTIIFIPGGGQYGNGANDLPLLLNDGMAQLLDEKKFPPSFKVNGKNYSFIVLTPQASGFPPEQDIAAFIAYAKKNFRVDSTRVYVSGLSVGGTATCTVAGKYASQVAAIVPISGENTSFDICESIARNKIPVWAFHNSNDPSISSNDATTFIARLNGYNPAIAPRLTLFPANTHDAWTQALDPRYKESNMNIYEWMLQYSK
jgi:predicted peptidase